MRTRHDSHRVADDVFLFTGTEVNWAIIQAGTDLTLIDAGWPGDIQEVERSIRSLGRQPQDLRAVLLTHAHADHTGALNHLHDSYGVPVYMAEAELPNAIGDISETGGPLDVAKQLYRPQVVRWATQIVKAGGLEHHVVTSASAFPNPGPLDCPGRPLPVPTPGHTTGHTSYLLPDLGVLISGDALVTAHPTFNGVGPRLLSSDYTHDQDSAARSLETLHHLDADTLLPGHGPTWYGPLSNAIDQALAHVDHRKSHKPKGHAQ